MSQAPRNSRPDARVVAQALAARIDDVVAWLNLAPGDKRQNTFTPINPVRADRTPGSFVIYGRGHAKAGGWVDFTEPDRLKGDAMDLLAYIKTGDPRDRRAGYALGLQFLGWEGASALTLPHQADARRALERDRELAEKNAADVLEQNRRKAFARWLTDRPLDPSLAVWRYLTLRSIDMERLAAEKRLPGAIRQRAIDFHRETKRELVSMSALIVSPDAKPWGVHRTFLMSDGSAKANVEPVRKIWPAGFWGGAIRLSKGKGDLSPEKAAAAGVDDEVLAISEGIETGLSVALVCDQWRVWAAGSKGAMGAVVWPKTVRAAVLLMDDDQSKLLAKLKEADAAGDDDACAKIEAALAVEEDQSERIVRKAALQAKERGAELYIARPKGGPKDWNDVLKSMAGVV